jgi:hypothetical protein
VAAHPGAAKAIVYLTEASHAQRAAYKRQPDQADAEYFNNWAPSGRLAQGLREFIEFVFHSFPFVLID